MPYTLKWIHQIAQIDQSAWDALALPLKTPLLEWQWLHQLEASGSVGEAAGWLPCHLTVWSGQKLVAAAPLYVKTHSAGEFVFDQVWAEVAHKLGTEYYPKIIGMSPFSPISGYRFMMAKGHPETELTERMLQSVHRFCARNRISGTHLLYSDPGWRHQPAGNEFIIWEHQSFIWENPGLATFDDYLARFNTNQRRNIKRERGRLHKAGIRLKTLCADDIPPDYIPLMYRLYADTNAKFGPWGCKYLTREFFERIYQHYRHRLVISVAYDDEHQQDPLGMAFLLKKGDTLYGRYWGSRREVTFLHFNVCYYEPIRWCIENQVRFFDPGLGSEHKLRRGFKAIPNYSLHHYYDDRLRTVMAMNMTAINRLERQHIEDLNAQRPFAKSG